MFFAHQISKTLIWAIIEDRFSDLLVSQMVWERLGYEPFDSSQNLWIATSKTPQEWRDNFEKSPLVISQRRASVQLTRSIPKDFKQLLKGELGFEGYSINDLYPRRTRRCTVANWLLAWAKAKKIDIPENGVIPTLLTPPSDPLRGHPGDPEIE